MKIVTDCAADLPASERETLGIIEAPLYIQFPEGEINSAIGRSVEAIRRLNAELSRLNWDDDADRIREIRRLLRMIRRAMQLMEIAPPTKPF